MLKRIFGTMFLLSCIAGSAFAEEKTEVQPLKKNTYQIQDESEFTTIVKNFESSWNKKNGQDFSKSFEKNADYVAINGARLKGKENIADDLQKLFDTTYKNVDVSLKMVKARLLRPDVAIVHVEANYLNQEDPSKNFSGQVLLVLKQDQNKKWDVFTYQYTNNRK